jgi:hypothetical protein
MWPRRLFQVHLKDGAVLKEEILTLETMREVKRGRHKHKGWTNPLGGGEPVHMALSPDDKWIYIGAPPGRGHKHVVFRNSMEKAGNPEVFAGVRGKSGKDDAHFDRVGGLACDSAGNVYVADSGNSRVQVFSSEGKLLKSIPVESPHLLAVGRRTGAIYVVSVTGRRRGNTTVTRFDGLKASAGKVMAKDMSLRAGCMALDDSGKIPVLWFTDLWRTISRWEDREGKLVKTKGSIIRAQPGWPGSWMSCARAFLAVDPVRGILYCKMPFFTDYILAADARTGKVLWKEGRRVRDPVRKGTVYARECQLGPDGMLYIRSFNGRFLARYDPDKRRYIGWPESPLQKKHTSDVMVLDTPSNASARGWTDPFCVAPNGDIYYPSGGFTKGDLAALKKQGLEYPTAKGALGPLAGSLIRVYDRQGRLKCLSALPGSLATVGIRVGRSGAAYIVMPCARIGGQGAGTLIKFNSRFDQFPIGRIRGSWHPKEDLKGKATHRWNGHSGNPRGPVRFENMAWDYGPVRPVAMGNACICMISQFALDPYERSFLPAAHKSAVNVLDANGNVIISIGGYGNADCRGKDSAVIDPKTGELRARRKDDPPELKSPLAELGVRFCAPDFTAVDDEALYVKDLGNERIVRVELKYHAEETVPLR